MGPTQAALTQESTAVHATAMRPGPYYVIYACAHDYPGLHHRSPLALLGLGPRNTDGVYPCRSTAIDSDTLTP